MGGDFLFFPRQNGRQHLFVGRRLFRLLRPSLSLPVVMLVIAGPAPHLFHGLSHQRDDGVIRQQAAARAVVVQNISQANGIHNSPPQVPGFGATLRSARRRKGESGRIMTQEMRGHKRPEKGKLVWTSGGVLPAQERERPGSP